MSITLSGASCLISEEIPASDGLDAMRVYWHDVGEGQGYVTITCWGCAWTCYFGGMMHLKIREFFGAMDVDYMVGTLGNATHLQQRKRDFDYLRKIVTAVRNQIRSEVPV